MKVKDPGVREFIEKCIAKVSERSSAKELLVDPFLRSDDDDAGSTGRSVHFITQGLESSVNSSLLIMFYRYVSYYTLSKFLQMGIVIGLIVVNFPRSTSLREVEILLWRVKGKTIIRYF